MWGRKHDLQYHKLRLVVCYFLLVGSERSWRPCRLRFSPPVLCLQWSPASLLISVVEQELAITGVIARSSHCVSVFTHMYCCTLAWFSRVYTVLDPNVGSTTLLWVRSVIYIFCVGNKTCITDLIFTAALSSTTDAAFISTNRTMLQCNKTCYSFSAVRRIFELCWVI